MSITEKDKDMTADYKDTEVTAFLKKIIVCILDFALIYSYQLISWEIPNIHFLASCLS